MSFTDKEIDALLASVDSALTKAEQLSKSNKLAKAFPPTTDKDDVGSTDAPPAPAADSAPPADAAPPAAPAADAAPPADAPPAGEPDGDEGAAPPQAPGAEGDQALEGEGQDQPLTDEELDQIYGSMDPAELQRHMAAIQKFAQGAAAAPAPEAPPAAPPMPPAAPPAMPTEKGEKGKQAAVDSKAQGGMVKAEDFKALQTQFDLLSKAVELMTKPTRKAVTSIQTIQKSEGDTLPRKTVNKEEIKPKLTELTKGSNLTKSEREMINEYCLYGSGEDKVIKLIETKEGGK